METKVPQGVAAPSYCVPPSDCASHACMPASRRVTPRSIDVGYAGGDPRISVYDLIPCSVKKSRLLFFTIPRADVGPVLSPEQGDTAGGQEDGPVDCSERRYSKPPTGSSEEYSVCQFFRDGKHEYVRRFVGAEEAIDAAIHYSSSVGAQIGMTRRVIITDGDDCINWEWRFGEGVVFPPPTAVAAKYE